MSTYNNDINNIDQDLGNESGQVQLNTSATSSENGENSWNKHKLSGPNKYIDKKGKRSRKNYQHTNVIDFTRSIKVTMDDITVREKMVNSTLA